MTRFLSPIVLGTSLALALAGPAAASGGDQGQARRALEKGEIRPLDQVLAAARAAVPGDVVALKLERESGKWRYELKVLTPSGQRREVEIDAHTLSILKDGKGRLTTRAEPNDSTIAMRVLIAEDEPRIAADVKLGLERAGYVADVVGDGEAALFQAEVEAYDVMVLDLGLPRLDGLTVLRRLRSVPMSLPVLILTARDGWRERVEGIDAGADDYLVKPFRIEELVARLRAILRRSAGHASAILKAGAVELDTRTRDVSVCGQPIALTALEYRLLSFLLHRQGQVVAPGDLIEHLYSSGSDREANAVEALLTRLRRKLGVPVIETRRGHGYLIATDATSAAP